jgi:hypothetical protein
MEHLRYHLAIIIIILLPIEYRGKGKAWMESSVGPMSRQGAKIAKVKRISKKELSSSLGLIPGITFAFFVSLRETGSRVLLPWPFDDDYFISSHSGKSPVNLNCYIGPICKRPEMDKISYPGIEPEYLFRKSLI